MPTFEDLSIFLLLVISTAVSVFIFNSIQPKKSFYQIYNELLKSETTKIKEIKILDNLHDYLEDYSNEQIIISNLQLGGKKAYYWYKILLVILISIVVFGTIQINISKNISTFLVYFMPSAIILIGMIICFCYAKYQKKINIQLKILLETIINITIKNIFIITTSLVIFLMFLTVYVIILISLVDENTTKEIFNTTISHILTYRIESTNGIQFSLATLFFTLAISGTVIFSITSSYLRQKRTIESKLSTQLEDYKKWYAENESTLNLNVRDTFNKDKLNKYYDALTDLHSMLNVSTIKELKTPIQMYDSFIYLIVTSYFLGIITSIIPADFMNLVFIFFIMMCGLFILLAYNIFKNYRN
ncbi:hypothetical protein ACSAZK_14360 [Methanosarcina sp. Mfa9]|uniref:hypothetical protein n=1 Tax=Methanosarcina sp. Mfa9 TaxID=3439063 RepID=UPI003F8383D1